LNAAYTYIPPERLQNLVTISSYMCTYRPFNLLGHVTNHPADVTRQFWCIQYNEFVNFNAKNYESSSRAYNQSTCDCKYYWKLTEEITDIFGS